MAYPKLVINMDKIRDNARSIVSCCYEAGIAVSGVVKVVGSDPKISELVYNQGCESLASSRLSEIKKLSDYWDAKEVVHAATSHRKPKFHLIRIPMLSEMEDVVKYVDTCLISDVRIAREAEHLSTRACERLEGAPRGCPARDERNGVYREHLSTRACEERHEDDATRRQKASRLSVLLMIELGDLREGIWNKDELISTALEIESMQHVHLKGVATNLGCYGAIRPTRDKLQELVNAAELIESKIGRRLETISGGGYTSLPLVWAGEMPERINHLRVGEGILIGYDVEKSTMLPAAGFESGTIVLQAEVVESRVKPTHPIGEILLDAFRVKPTYDDFGEQARVIVAVGRGDYGATDGITPRNQNLKIIGASSDHTLLMDKIGDEMKNSLPNSILDRKTGVFVSEIELGRESRVVGGRTATSD
ncbi:MAG: alanine racemase, partial [Clostridiales Family XIII bacterium]|nr:alanine racemase [Clostridiales Family XIII bacterium]